nr:MAG TPA: hypothetical protein [Caudoviricetes sp.]
MPVAPFFCCQFKIFFHLLPQYRDNIFLLPVSPYNAFTLIYCYLLPD